MLLQTAAGFAAVFPGTGAVAQSSAVAGRHASTGALLFQDDPEFWYEIVRLFGAAEYGGALFGEVVAIAQRINAGDYDSWYDANDALAGRMPTRPSCSARKAIGSAHAIVSCVPAVTIAAPNSSYTPIRTTRA
jgi:hypothetical protein